jgi:hypothetical protein
VTGKKLWSRPAAWAHADKPMAFKIHTDGTRTPLVDSDRETIRSALDGAWLGFVELDAGPDAAGMFIDDQGLAKRLAVNGTASTLARRPVAGPAVVITSAELAKKLI